MDQSDDGDGSALRRALGRTGWLAIEPQAAALPSIARNPQRKENAMPLMTGDDYRQSLLDGRRCYIDGDRISDYIDGDRISDPSTHPLLARAVTSVAATYDRFYSPDPCAFHPEVHDPEVARGPRRPDGAAQPRLPSWRSRGCCTS
jgi:hypothetical protein